ncbi:MAG TPA: YciI family protein [Vicinamibacterales bacterium]
MRFMIAHQTNAHWESGAIPDSALTARVGAFMGELAHAGVLLAAEGLRSSCEGVRLRFSGGQRTITPGPLEPGNELPAGFTILHTSSIDEAIEWAARQAAITGDVEVDIRPVMEPWDVGLGPPPPEPTRRYMVLRKATAASEAGEQLSRHSRARLSDLIEAATRNGAHVVSERLKPSRRGRRLQNTKDGVVSFDGPFVETKELLGGYAIVSSASLDEASRLAMRYIQTVGAEVVDVRELE